MRRALAPQPTLPSKQEATGGWAGGNGPSPTKKPPPATKLGPTRTEEKRARAKEEGVRADAFMDATDDRMEPRSISASAVFKQLTCAVCADLYVDPVLAPCSHSFCRTCITRAISVNQRCPLCRAEIPSPAMLHANLSLAALVGELRVACKYRRYGCASEVTLESKVAQWGGSSHAPHRVGSRAAGGARVHVLVRPAFVPLRGAWLQVLRQCWRSRSPLASVPLLPAAWVP